MSNFKIKSIKSFTHEYAFLNKDYLSPIQYGRWRFPSLSHAFEASRSTNEVIQQEITKCNLNQLDEISMRIITRPNWNAVSIMKDLLDIKFGATTILVPGYELPMKFYKLLAQTGSARLIFGNKYHDNFWGVCECGDQTRGCIPAKAKNYLGFALEAVRDRIHSKIKNNFPNPKCECGKPASRQVLYSFEWHPVVKGFCNNQKCETKAISTALKVSSDNLVLDYDALRGSTLTYMPLEVKEDSQNKQILSSRDKWDEEDMMDYYGFTESGVPIYGQAQRPWLGFPAPTVVIDRKWETLVIKC